MSFTFHETRDQLSAALQKLESSPKWDYLLSIISTTKVALKGLFPFNKLRLYSYEKNGTTYWFAHRGYDIVRSMTYIAADGPVISEDFQDGLKLFNDTEGLTNGEPRSMLVVDQTLSDMVTEFISNHAGKTPVTIRSTRFYMTPEQQKLTRVVKLIVPDGYILGSCIVEDNHVIMDNYGFGDKGDDEQMRRKIRSFPSSAIRHNGNVAAFYLCDPAVMLHHQFTLVEHRSKGLGKIIEFDLSQKQIEKGFTPYKNIVSSNEVAIGYTSRSKYFTKSVDEHGDDLVLSYMLF